MSDKVYQPTEGTNSPAQVQVSQPVPPPGTNPGTNNVPPTLPQDTTGTHGQNPVSSTTGGNSKRKAGPGECHI